MTNGEFYKEELKEIEDAGDVIAIIDGMPTKCSKVINCENCERYLISTGRCSGLGFVIWHESKYIKKIEATNDV